MALKVFLLDWAKRKYTHNNQTVSQRIALLRSARILGQQEKISCPHCDSLKIIKHGNHYTLMVSAPIFRMSGFGLL